ncbi:MAG: transcriptional regulator [Alphaproteobacteria bacterium CG11_big_fil_rev_8_21_14_0_20_44_7]|nr:MAG: transcriptional regulator [Alphaproteobacteria bacterium CG11_big_fil_rev_8_21_14_0_20_44_7]
MSANPVDIHVGKRLRLRRTIMGMSQESLAEALGITFQQVQKYEKGINRVSASRLYEISDALNSPVSFFFEDYNQENPVYGFAEDSDGFEEQNIKSRESMVLLRSYYQISDPKIRKKALELIKSLADNK